MRRVRYSVVMSLDGYIAGPNGEADWITPDPDFDFNRLLSQFDALLVGRRTFDTMVAARRVSMPGMKTIVFSRTLKPKEHPQVTIVAKDQKQTIAALKATTGKDIWLFGGGALFASLAKDGLVETVEVRVEPVLLGTGVPFYSDLKNRIKLTLTAQRSYPSGVVDVEYAVRAVRSNIAP
jgi:dihydrofolate reductase